MLSHQELVLAWVRVKQNNGCAGSDGQTIAEFEVCLQDNLATLKTAIDQQTYRPKPLKRVYLRKANKVRPLSIPTVRDRVVQTALADCLTPLLEPLFEDVSYAYRAGRSVEQAVAQVIRLYQAGYHWVVDADIDRYFDQVNHSSLLTLLDDTLVALEPEHKERLIALIKQWMTGTVLEGDREHVLCKGLPQGSPLSPLLANLYLDQLDDALLAKGKQVVRFADDFLILCKSEIQAQKCLRLTGGLLADMQLSFNNSKTQIVHFDHGFKFLGWQFLRSMVYRPQKTCTDPARFSGPFTPLSDVASNKIDRLKQQQAQPNITQSALSIALQKALDDASKAAPVLDENASGAKQARSPAVQASHQQALLEKELSKKELSENGVQLDNLQKTLYLTRNDLKVSKTSKRLIVQWEDCKRRIPLRQVDQIVVFGNAQFSTPAIRLCLREKVAIHFLNSAGYYQGRLHSPAWQTSPLQLAQYHKLGGVHKGQGVADSSYINELGRSRNRFNVALIDAKLANSMTLLRRLQRRASPDLKEQIKTQIPFIRQQRSQLKDTHHIDALLGLEGVAAKAYFSVLGAFFQQAGWAWPGRQSRAGNCPLNAMFNYVYSLLYNNVLGLIGSAGLNPYIGYLHTSRANHATLASDLMEPFRSMIADQIVISCVRSGSIRNDHVIEAASGERQLNREAVSVLIQRFEARMNTTFEYQRPYGSAQSVAESPSPRATAKLDLRRIIADQITQTKAWVLGEQEHVEFFNFN